ncbi:MAG TPA: DUF2252 family protein [Gemmatimonadales bacterium]|jgi:uncharacterized protein (DUF2252 family)|nr:DUF2252 family protein [Gemmatimonadales bacterium]
MHIHQAVREYERWLRSIVRPVPADFRRKHALMREDKFQFFRGTFFRWAQQWQEWCPEAGTAPRVVAVGDLHIETFGTWRDLEGRLVWGVNDLDEAWRLPYTNDLVRLTASALIAGGGSALSLGAADTADAILQGYQSALEWGGRPFVLAEHHAALRTMSIARLRDAKGYWDNLDAMPAIRARPAAPVFRWLRRALPPGSQDERWRHRLAGIGSLGRERITLVADCCGSRLAREAKALAPSACAWTAGRTGPRRRWYRFLLDRAVRCHDPAVQIKGSWILRRLAPDCSRIDLPDLATAGDMRHLLDAMGRETANIHLASGRRKLILRDLAHREPAWLLDSAQRAVEAVSRDFESWAGAA